MGMYDALHRALGLQARSRGTVRYPRSGTPLEVVHRKPTPKSQRVRDEGPRPLAFGPRVMEDPVRTLGHPPRPRKRKR